MIKLSNFTAIDRKDIIKSLEMMIKGYFDIVKMRQAKGEDITEYVDLLERIDQLHASKTAIAKFYMY